MDNYPNPFNPTTVINYSVSEDNQQVLITVYNAKGQLVKRLVNSKKSAGEYSITWDGTTDSGRTVPSGIYYYRMKSGDYRASKKMLLLK